MKALIVGSAGQDGRLLDAQLRARGTETVGIVRGDVPLGDRAAVADLVRRQRPDEIYYLAAHHHSSEQAAGDDVDLLRTSLDVHVHGLVHVLEAVAHHASKARLFYASSSHVFGRPSTSLQNEDSPRRPINVYGMTKSLGMDVVRYWRETRGLHASSGILYNHESPLRGESFVTTRIVRGAREAAVAKASGEVRALHVGSLSAVVDWGWAPDYTEAMQRIVACDVPDDYVVATGEPHTVDDFARVAFSAVGLDSRDWIVEVDGLVKKAGATLVGDAAKLRARTGWRPTIGFDEMVVRLVATTTPTITDAKAEVR